MSRSYDSRAVWGWALYDFANSAYTTVIITFVYALFFTANMGTEALDGQTYWTRAATFTGLVVAITSPYLGALADRGGIRRGMLLTSTVVCVIFTALLWIPMPGQVWLALLFLVVSNIAFELSGVFYNSYLPDLAPEDRIGRISGYGWALGYVGGFLCTGLALWIVFAPTSFPLPLDQDRMEEWRAVPVLVATWFAVFSIPMFRWVREPAHVPSTERPSMGRVFRQASRQIADTFQEIRSQYKDIFRLLVARVFYNDGLVTVFVVGPIFVSQAYDMQPLEVLIWGLAVQATAMVGAFAMGFLDDRVGGKRTLIITVVGMAVGGAWAVLASSLTSIYLAGLWIGIFVGPNQAASRSLLGRFVPEAKETEFYGFLAFSGKAIAFMGPFLYGEISQATGSVRVGMAAILVFFLIGGLLLLSVNEARGIAAREGRAPVVEAST
ncbi:MAG: MFS transporter [Gemmatimonadota bacterium]|jgi:UMF1 family MFS transporter